VLDAEVDRLGDEHVIFRQPWSQAWSIRNQQTHD